MDMDPFGPPGRCSSLVDYVLGDHHDSNGYIVSY